MPVRKYALGLDFGTNSVRALLVNLGTGEEVANHVHDYEAGRNGIIVDPKDPNVARQHPADYLKGIRECFEHILKKTEKMTGFDPRDIIGIGVDTTGSTPMPVDVSGQPLALKKEFSRNLNALAWLWKDHSSYAEAEEITELASSQHPEYLAMSGGKYSSEWFFSKVLHCLRRDPAVYDAASSWVELVDFIPAVLTGRQKPAELKRSVCAAGHKAMYNEKWGGLPDKAFLGALSHKLAALRQRLYDKAYTADVRFGVLRKEYASKYGLGSNVAVSVGAFDAHVGAVGAGINPGTLVKIIGTSSCDMMVVPNKQKVPEIPGLCGIVDGSVLPGHWGLEAGQSAVGDIFNWFTSSFVPPEYYAEATENRYLDFRNEPDIHRLLSEKAAQLRPGETGLLALDWNNGNRTVLVDARLTGLLLGQTLHTKPEEVYRALVEASAFGAKIIINRFEEYGVRVKDIICCGGIAEKNPFIMQLYADVTGRPMEMSRSAQTCALGAALFGAVAAGKDVGGFDKIEDVQAAICKLKPVVYRPNKAASATYDRIFALYQKLHDVFGTPQAQLNLFDVMKTLLAIKSEAAGGRRTDK